VGVSDTFPPSISRSQCPAFFAPPDPGRVPDRTRLWHVLHQPLGFLATAGRPGLPPCLKRRQYSPNRFCCHVRTVRGCTQAGASYQPVHRRASQPQRRRSIGWRCGLALIAAKRPPGGRRPGFPVTSTGLSGTLATTKTSRPEITGGIIGDLIALASQEKPKHLSQGCAQGQNMSGFQELRVIGNYRCS
jgi:hypothetical protein